MNVDVLIEVTGIGNFSGHGNQMRQRIGYGFCGVVSDQQSQQHREKGTAYGRCGTRVAGRVSGLGGLIERFADVVIGTVQDHRRFG